MVPDAPPRLRDDGGGVELPRSLRLPFPALRTKVFTTQRIRRTRRPHLLNIEHRTAQEIDMTKLMNFTLAVAVFMPLAVAALSLAARIIA